MSLKSQVGFDLVGITVCVCFALGKAIFLPIGKGNHYFEKDDSSYS